MTCLRASGLPSALSSLPASPERLAMAGRGSASKEDPVYPVNPVSLRLTSSAAVLKSRAARRSILTSYELCLPRETRKMFHWGAISYYGSCLIRIRNHFEQWEARRPRDKRRFDPQSNSQFKTRPMTTRSFISGVFRNRTRLFPDYRSVKPPLTYL
jgi:hypothetical protein